MLPHWWTRIASKSFIKWICLSSNNDTTCWSPIANIMISLFEYVRSSLFLFMNKFSFTPSSWGCIIYKLSPTCNTWVPLRSFGEHDDAWTTLISPGAGWVEGPPVCGFAWITNLRSGHVYTLPKTNGCAPARKLPHKGNHHLPTIHFLRGELIVLGRVVFEIPWIILNLSLWPFPQFKELKIRFFLDHHVIGT